MPTYEYECTNCGWRFEVFQKMSDAPKGSCPKCGKVLRRLIGAGAGIIFKGSGFYATDYRKPWPCAQEQGKKEDRREDKLEDKPGKKDKDSVCSKCPSTSECDNKKDNKKV